MLWLIWRQHRIQALITAGLLLAIGVTLLVLGLGNADIAAEFASNPAALDRRLRERYEWVAAPLTLLSFAPAAIGLFWGAPVLGREFERGTHRLAWTQSVSPRRWLTMKLGVLATAVVLAGLAVGAMVNAWLSTFDGTTYGARFSNQSMFEITGVMPAAWWLCAFMVGVAAGAVFRRTLPAMAATLALVAMVLGAIFSDPIRDRYAPAERIVLDFTSTREDTLANDGVAYRRDIIDANDQVITDNRVLDSIYCSAADPECTPPPGVRQVLYYHPPGQYWRFQWTETALLVIISLGLGALAVRRTAGSRI